MASKTPEKSIRRSLGGNQFSPIRLQESPGASQNNITGLPRTVRDLAADLYNSIQHWNDYHILGAKIVKQIASLKSHTSKQYPDGLEKLCSEFYSSVQSMKEIVCTLQGITKKISAIRKLHKDTTALFITMSTSKMEENIHLIVEAYEKELEVKERVLENIGLCKNNDALFYALRWTYQQHVTDNINLKLEAILTETGHRKFTDS